MRIINNVSVKLAANAVLFIFTSITVFHVLVLTGFIPFNVVWGGRLDDTSQMLLFESMSLALALFVIFLVAMRGGYLGYYLPKPIVRLMLWIFVVIFSLSTIGNLFAANLLERFVFTPIASLCALLFYRLAMEQQ